MAIELTSFLWGSITALSIAATMIGTIAFAKFLVKTFGRKSES